MFEPIQRYLPRYFDTNPAKHEAIRLRAPTELTVTWEIRDEQLFLSWGEISRVYALSDYTVGSLVDALQEEGFILDPGYNQWLLALGAVVLLEGRGTLTDVSGTPWYAFTSLLHAITRPVEREWRQYSAAIPFAVAQLILTSATNGWADLFGDIFGIPRRGTMASSPWRALAAQVDHCNPMGTSSHERTLRLAWQQFFANLLALSRETGEADQHWHERLVYAARRRVTQDLPSLESDADYTARIVQEVLRARSTPLAILGNIRRLTGHDLMLREPWQEWVVLSKSNLSGSHHLQGAPIYEYHRMQLVANRGLDWKSVLPEAEADRPAGTLMLPPATKMPPIQVTIPPPHPTLGRVSAHSQELRWNAYGRLSVDLMPSHYLPPPAMAIARVRVFSISTIGLRGPYEYSESANQSWLGTWNERPWLNMIAQPEMFPPKVFES